MTSAPKILIGCETSGTVRDAFLALGYDAWSCDILPSEKPTNRHIQDDIRNVLNDGWDMLAVMHPPCTRLCNSGVRWLTKAPPNRTLAEMWAALDDGAALFSACWNAPIPHIACENPVMHKYAKARIQNYQPAAQTVQPWWFGDPEFKATGLYLRNLPPLTPTNKLVPPAAGTPEHKAWSRVHRMPPGPERWRERSRFFPGIAAAMADQWGSYVMAARECAA